MRGSGTEVEGEFQIKSNDGENIYDCAVMRRNEFELIEPDEKEKKLPSSFCVLVRGGGLVLPLFASRFVWPMVGNVNK